MEVKLIHYFADKIEPKRSFYWIEKENTVRLYFSPTKVIGLEYNMKYFHVIF